MKQAYSSGPKKVKGSADPSGTKAAFGHAMGGMFGYTPKKPGADLAPPTRAKSRQQRSARMARLSNKLI